MTPAYPESLHETETMVANLLALHAHLHKQAEIAAITLEHWREDNMDSDPEMRAFLLEGMARRDRELAEKNKADIRKAEIEAQRAERSGR